MKSILRLLLYSFIFVLPFSSSTGQVQDLSYTLSPSVEYINWDNRSGLNDGLLVGGKLGFGFGQYIELSGQYFTTVDNNLQTDFSDYDFDNYDELYDPHDVRLERYGAEMKFNFSNNSILPYLTVGSGIQRTEIKLNNSSNIINNNIYMDFGLGFQFSLADRYTLSLAVKNSQYRINALRDFLTDEERGSLGIIVDETEQDRYSNWGANASLKFYIGGRDPDEMTALDKAYRNTFSNNLRGVSVPVEPGTGIINFHDDMPYKNGWYLGIASGLNIGDYIGLRAFYRQMLNSGSGSTFDALGMYGGEIIFNLNSGGGIIPYLNLGGGYINPGDNYIPREGMVAQDQPYFSAGAGLTLPFSPYFKLFGSANAMFISNMDASTVSQPNEVLTSWNYNFGMRLIIGKQADDPNKIVMEGYENQQKKYQQKEENIKTKYKSKMDSLEAELKQAYANEDSIRAEAILATRDSLTEENSQPQQSADTQDPASEAPRKSEGMIQMSPEDLRMLMKQMTDYHIEMKKLDLEGEKIELERDRLRYKYQKNNTSEATFGDTPSYGIDKDILSGQILYSSGSDSDSIDLENDDILSDEIDSSSIESDSVSLDNVKVDSVKLDSVVIGNIDLDVTSIDTFTSDSSEKIEMKLDSILDDTASLRINMKKSDLKSLIAHYNEKIETMQSQSTQYGDSLKLMQDKVQRAEKELIRMQKQMSEDKNNSSVEGDQGFIFEAEGLGVSAGYTFGDLDAATFSIRPSYYIYDRWLKIMPEAFVGLGDETIFGLTANAIVNARFNNVNTYFGVGGGVQQISSQETVESLFNLIIGVGYDVWEGEVFLDYMNRNISTYHQISAGYKFNF